MACIVLIIVQSSMFVALQWIFPYYFLEDCALCVQDNFCDDGFNPFLAQHWILCRNQSFFLHFKSNEWFLYAIQRWDNYEINSDNYERAFNPLSVNQIKWSNTLKFFECVWPFCLVGTEKVKELTES